MNYSKIYSDFIDNRRLKESALTGYSEKHHIIPKSLGGDNSKSNIINLAPEDHYFAHMLLARYAGSGMKSAFYFMSHDGTKSAYGIKPTRHTYAWSKKHFMENLPDHIADMGNRLAENEKRITGFKKWVSKGEISETVKARYRDPEYFKKWKESQKDVWTDDRREKRGALTKESWKNPAYLEKMKGRKTSSGAYTSEKLKDLWRDSEYRKRMSAERRGRAKNPEWIKKMKAVGRKRHSCWWQHEVYGHVYRCSIEMSEIYGGHAMSWSKVRTGNMNSIFGWTICRDPSQLEFDGF